MNIMQMFDFYDFSGGVGSLVIEPNFFQLNSLQLKTLETQTKKSNMNTKPNYITPNSTDANGPLPHHAWHHLYTIYRTDFR